MRAKRLGVPWFRVGKQRRKPVPIRYHRLQTKNIKPQSPWMSQAKPQPTERSFIKPQSPRASQPRRQPVRVGLDRSPKYYPKLDSLTHSHDASTRLVTRLSERHPDKDERWCVEKAIYDIERDRMAR